MFFGFLRLLPGDGDLRRRVDAVGHAAGFALASLLGSHTIIWPRPRLAHA